MFKQGTKYPKLTQISRRALSWLERPVTLGAIWTEFSPETNTILLKSTSGELSVVGDLTLAQARALKTLLESEIQKAEKAKV